MEGEVALGGLAVVWSDACLRHDGACGTWVGVGIDGDELPERALLIRDALVAAGAHVVEAESQGDATLLAVHDPGLVEFLRTAYARWVESGYPTDPGQQRVLGYIFPTPGMLAGIEPLEPASGAARTGMWAFDTLTVVGEGTWAAARAAIDCALTAADLVSRDGGVAYACTRPPGHHVTRSAYGGSCYLNNAAVAAERLREHGAKRVAIVDVDAHHGNGAQAIFWARGDVLTGSVHVDPRAGWFPHFLGVEGEVGAGAGAGANRNVPLVPGTRDEGWLAAVEALSAWVDGVDALVIALGVDAAAGDPNSPLLVTEHGYRTAGERLGRPSRPTVVVQEGGYELETIGPLVCSFLSGLVDPKVNRLDNPRAG